MPTVHDEQASTWSSVHLDAVRGAAALAVMTFHVKGFFFSSLSDPKQAAIDEAADLNSSRSAAQIPTPPTHRHIDMGTTPVMMFFVLSGYLVGGSIFKALKRGRWSTGDYLIKRLTRLWVVLIPAILFGILLDNLGFRVFGVPGNVYVDHIGYVYPHVAENFQLSTILGNFAFLQGIFVTTPGTNGALWSLANEFWYYMLFPLIVVPLFLRKSIWIQLGSILFVAGFLTMVSLRTDPASLKHIPLLFPIWILGALLSLAPLKIPVRARSLCTAMMVVAVVAGTMIMRRLEVPVHPAQWISATLFTCLLYTLLHYQGKSVAGIYRSIAGFFSKISYSLYLVHMPVGAFLAAWLLRPWHMRAKTPANFLIYFGFCGLIVLITYGFYLAFEANTDKVRKLITRKQKPTALGSLSVQSEQ
jgi:peptidoglycan/LPS O-acetylase OafA/YrhL